MGFFDIFKKKNKEVYTPIVSENPLKVQICTSAVDNNYLKDDEVYTPARKSMNHYKVMHIELDYAQAIELGWHFRRKASKSVKITRYTGGLKNIIIPSKIGGYTVNEIGGLAFQKTDINCVQIPDTVKKLNERCFFMSKVKIVTFADGIQKIPAESFCRCENLAEIHLPNTLWRSIEKKAFFGCTSLKYINIPRCDIGDEAFRYSGLEQFTYCSFHFDGKAFSGTPMHKKYKIITAPSYYRFGYDYNIKLVGKNAEIKFPMGCSVYLAENSVTHDCTLDFSDCHEVRINPNAFVFEYNNYGIYSRPCYSIIMPNNHKYCYFPEFVDVRHADGSAYEGIFENKGETADGTVIHVHGDQLPPLSLNHCLKNIVLESDNSIKFSENAVNIWELESFSSDCLYGNGVLFSPFCHNLHKVRFKGNCVYIPSFKMINKDIHCQLMKAFSGWNTDGFFHFFDDSIIDDVFRDRRLSQMSRIIIAVDVLRSTENLFGNREMYVKYLKNHRHYAEIICSKIPDEFYEYRDYIHNSFLNQQ